MNLKYLKGEVLLIPLHLPCLVTVFLHRCWSHVFACHVPHFVRRGAGNLLSAIDIEKSLRYELTRLLLSGLRRILLPSPQAE